MCRGQAWIPDLRDPKKTIVSFSNGTCAGADLSNMDLSYAGLGGDTRGANFRNSILHHADAKHSDFSDCDFSATDARGADLNYSKFIGAQMSDANWAHTFLFSSIFTGITARRINLYGSVMSHTTLMDADLQNADMRRVSLYQADLTGANLSNANLTAALFSPAIPEPRFGGIIQTRLEGTTLTGTILRKACLLGLDLPAHMLETADVQTALVDSKTTVPGDRSIDDYGFTFIGPNVNLSDMDLEDVHLCKADLTGANLTGVRMARASLHSTQLMGADLRGADIRGASLRQAHLEGCNLAGATYDRYTLWPDKFSATLHGAIEVFTPDTETGREFIDDIFR